MESPSQPVNPLEYAPPSKTSARFVRQALITCIAAAIGALAFIWIPWLYRYIEISYWARECLNYNPPPNQVVYDCNFNSMNTPATCVPNPTLDNFQSFFDRSIRPFPSTFVHRLSRPDGQTRLVICSLNFFRQVQFQTIITFETTTWMPSPSAIPWRPAATDRRVFDLGPPLHLKVYAGVIDTNNASHFTIPLDIDGQHNLIDGWLKNDESIFLGPITPASAATALPPASPVKSPPPH